MSSSSIEEKGEVPGAAVNTVNVASNPDEYAEYLELYDQMQSGGHQRLMRKREFGSPSSHDISP